MKWNDKKPYLYAMLAGFGTIALSVLFFFLIYRFKGFSGAIGTLVSILSPFLYGAVMAYVLRPMCSWYGGLLKRHLPERIRGAADGLSVALTILTALAIVYTLFLLIIPQFINNIVLLANTVPAKIQQGVAWAEGYVQNDPQLLELLNTSSANFSTDLDNWLKNTVVPYLQTLLSSFGLSLLNFFSVIKNLGIGLIVSVYFLLSRRKFLSQARIVLYSALPKSLADRVADELSYANRMFQGFIGGQLLDSLLVGLICYAFVLIIGIRNSMLIAVIVGLTNLIPFFGPFIGATPSVLLILMESPIKAVWFLIFIIVLQQFDGNIMAPRILGGSTGLSSFWVLFSILLFGGLWGFAGILVAVPLFAVIYDLLRKLIIRGLYRNGCEDMLIRYNRRFGAPPEAAGKKPRKS
jgi:predicted PurR-regulated permease PerM